MTTYIAFHRTRQVIVQGKTVAEAQLRAAEHFNIKRPVGIAVISVDNLKKLASLF